MKPLLFVLTLLVFNIQAQKPIDSSNTRKTIFFNEDLLLVLEEQQRESLITNELLIKNVSSIHEDDVKKLHEKTMETWDYLEQLKSYIISSTGGLDTDGYSPVAKYDCEKIEEMVCDTSGRNLFRLAESMVNEYLEAFPSELRDIDSFEFEFDTGSEAYKPITNSEKTRVDLTCMNLMEAQYLLTIMQLKIVGKERSFILQKVY